MRKQIRRIVPLITLLAWLCTVTAFAVDTPTVIYDSGIGTFTFQNLDNDGLFGAFQDLMPGDERTTEIRIEMKNLSRSARLYLRAEPNSEDVEVLKTLKLSVKKNGATLDESNAATSLNQNVLLGTFSGDSTTVLDMTLTVPVTVGNEMAQQTGELQWIFTIQEDGDDPIVGPVPSPQTGDDKPTLTDPAPTKPDIPAPIQNIIDIVKTGDTTNIIPWVLIAISSLVIIIVLYRKRKEK